ncbi:hypothetical protein ACP275_12G048500 [Erythranthe tilingii]
MPWQFFIGKGNNCVLKSALWKMSGEVGLARKCIESILTGKSHLLLNNENHDNRKSTKQTKSPDIFLPDRSSYQDLEYICVKNNWRLTKYFVAPSDGNTINLVPSQKK